MPPPSKKTLFNALVFLPTAHALLTALPTVLLTVYSASAFLSARARAIACASTTLPVGFNVRPSRMVNDDLLANGEGLLIGDLLLRERYTVRFINISSFGVLNLIVIAAFIILTNSNNVIYNKEEGVILFLYILNIY